MSTNSNIAVKTAKGYKTIYCHHDGYPSYMYPMLRDWYGTQERAEALVSFGDASVIDKRLVPSPGSIHCFNSREEGVCVFYNRDRGEDFYITIYDTKEELLRSQFYVYVFEDGCWRAYLDGQEADDYSSFDD
jgi:hypothetical protein